jgi:general secretion pathway protein J
MSRRGNAHGFTLLEMLVVLILVALVSGLLFEAVSRVGDLRVRLSRNLDGAFEATLTSQWFRGTVAMALPDHDGGVDSFKGTPSSFNGLTAQALDGWPGTPTPFAWRLVGEPTTSVTRLEYRSGDGSWREIARWSGLAARFRYAGPDGNWIAEWPPALSGGGRLGAVVQMQTPQLPRFVRLDGAQAPDSWSTVVAVVGTTHTPQRIGDFLRALR